MKKKCKNSINLEKIEEKKSDKTTLDSTLLHIYTGPPNSSEPWLKLTSAVTLQISLDKVQSFTSFSVLKNLLQKSRGN